MMDFLTQFLVWLNTVINPLAEYLLTPLASLAGWLSNTIIASIAGLVLMIIFKYTSNQKAIGKVKNGIKANLLALKLFKDSLTVTFKSQAGALKGAFLLLFYSIRPMLVMIIPVSLLLSQMGLWYQVRPLQPGEQAIITVELNSKLESSWPQVSLKPQETMNIIMGPVRVFSKHQLYWQIEAKEPGYHNLVFDVDGQQVDKELAVGGGFMRVSAKRPSWQFSSILLHPKEKPFSPDSVVKSISIDYPPRLSRTSGADWWVIYFFIVSLVVAFIFKPFLKVKI